MTTNMHTASHIILFFIRPILPHPCLSYHCTIRTKQEYLYDE
ncbi:hypothetical protein A343_1399 [Porphyromonas gingivalis JCVI SC001]|nr:hypothetical protein A343_1399 [Porphyromonas gingivalis JCVI SC001]ERJ87235.1 hypothetical protein HMPREF1989_00733 [Porphyromonas gingivalis F0566]